MAQIKTTKGVLNGGYEDDRGMGLPIASITLASNPDSSVSILFEPPADYVPEFERGSTVEASDLDPAETEQLCAQFLRERGYTIKPPVPEPGLFGNYVACTGSPPEDVAITMNLQGLTSADLDKIADTVEPFTSERPIEHLEKASEVLRALAQALRDKGR